MTKVRVFMFILTILVVGTLAYFAGLYARGFRFDFKKKTITEGGLLVAKSVPDGAFIAVNGAVLGATNDNISLPPGEYDVEIRREGYTTWNKKIVIQKEIVTEVEAYLFKKAPTLIPITNAGANQPVISMDLTKLSYSVPESGLWVLEVNNSPLGFSREPKMISPGNFDQATYIFSPDSTRIYVDTQVTKFIIPTNLLSTVNARTLTPVSPFSDTGIWKTEVDNANKLLVKNLPSVLSLFLTDNANFLSFSPDKNKILYTVAKKATLPGNIITPFPGASTQKEERETVEKRYYVYDVKEDKNFAVGEVPTKNESAIYWFPTSEHLLLANAEGVWVMDYDGTNKTAVYSGSYVAPYAFPTISSDRIIILTNFGNSASPANLYSVGIR